MLINTEQLKKMKPLMVDEFYTKYQLDNGLIAILYNPKYAILKDEFYNKYQYSKEIKSIDGLNMPVDVLDTEFGFSGYIEKEIPGLNDGSTLDFADYQCQNSRTITLDEITKAVMQTCRIIREGHAEGIVFPEITSEDKVLYNTKTGED